MSQPKIDVVDYINERLGVSKRSHPRWLIKMIEKNGLLIISMATASIYWYFDSLHSYKLYSRIYTAFLFVCYGVFTQYLINEHKAMKDELKELHQELKRRDTIVADRTSQ